MGGDGLSRPHDPRGRNLPQPRARLGRPDLAGTADPRLHQPAAILPPARPLLQRGADPPGRPAAGLEAVAGFGVFAGAVHLGLTACSSGCTRLIVGVRYIKEKLSAFPSRNQKLLVSGPSHVAKLKAGFVQGIAY